jgi:hypothetical protein
MPLSLTQQESTARKILIAVAKGNLKTGRPGLISYKELWHRLNPNSTWGQNRTRQIVGLITVVSAFELERGRPPLNELVVQTRKAQPKEPWRSIKGYLKDEFGQAAPYKSHSQAQAACWNYWNRKKAGASAPPIHDAAEEGDPHEKTARFRRRNQWLIEACRKRDNHRCKACRFRLEVGGSFVIDVHHLKPLSLGPGLRVTSLDDLVCLCPTCHRIAHRRSPKPLPLAQIRVERKRLRPGGP